ncbi:hypothetical protein IF125_08790 [Empedobacter stercoris]|uniref:hypothetical protein n=1 Tax=Empedobacter stercoris TaxID=1628248 RepID=UPI001CE0E67E|nr:hypothetical protein [Empedobacter stercoris]MCA4782361.1 hypothetical protein [Empedobacter stercoris]
MSNKKCQTCGKPAHNFEKEEALDCVPPKDVLIFGKYSIDKNYRKALFKEAPFYTSEEIVGSYLGYNHTFPSQDEWLDSKNK